MPKYNNSLSTPLASIVPINLVGQHEMRAREILLAGVSGERRKEADPPSFPGQSFSHPLEEQQSDEAKADFIQHMAPLVEMAFSNKHWRDVISITDVLVRQAPSALSSKIYYMRGQALLREGQPHQAREALDLDQQLYSKEDNDAPVVTVREAIEIILDIHAEHITEQLRQTNPDKDTYSIFKMEFRVPKGTSFVDTSNVRWKISSLVIIGHSHRETELIEMEDGSFGSAQIAFGKTKTVDAKSLVTIVEHEAGLNSAAILVPSNDKEVVNIVDLREAKRTQQLRYRNLYSNTDENQRN